MAVQAFEGNKAETATMVPVLQKFMTKHQIADVVVVADAGMFSAGNIVVQFDRTTGNLVTASVSNNGAAGSDVGALLARLCLGQAPLHPASDPAPVGHQPRAAGAQQGAMIC